MKVISSNNTIDVPESIAKCPICDKPIIVDEIREWETETRAPVSISIECTTMPDFDSDEWNDWLRWHWSTPYIDWLPVENRVLDWLRETHRIQDG